MMMYSRRGVLAAGAAAAVSFGVRPAVVRERSGDPSVVVAWNRTLLGIVRTPGAQPATVHATRAFAIMHAAVHDAVVAATGTGRPYAAGSRGDRGASPVAAAAAAAHDVLSQLYPARRPDLDGQLAAELAAVTDPAARAKGERRGRLAARLLLALRAGDGSAASPPPLPTGTEPGQYRPTPPGFAPAVFTHWPAVTPFVLDRAARFRPVPYPALAGARYAAALNEVEALGQDTSTTRDADQAVQARFWAAPIWNYWNEIAQSVVADRRADLATAAHVFARLNLAFADAVIAFYEAKYHYRIWRPVTAVRLADQDTNPATAGDAGWNALATTPPDPAYPGAHSVIARAGAEILSATFGPANRLAVSSEALPGTQRHFGRFSDVAEEAGLSRIFAGVHTRLDHESGRRMGAGIARFVLDRT